MSPTPEKSGSVVAARDHIADDHGEKTVITELSTETLKSGTTTLWHRSEEDLLQRWTVAQESESPVELVDVPVKVPQPPSAPTLDPQTQDTAMSSKEKKNPFALKPEQKTALKHFWRIFTYSSRTDRLLIMAATTASLATGVTMPIMNVVFGKVFQKLTIHAQSGGDDGAQYSFMDGIIECVMYLVYIFVARIILEYISYLGFRMSSLRISAAIRLEYMKSLFQQPISVLDALPPGQTAAIITITASILQAGISEKLGQFIQSVSLVVSALVISFLYSWNLTLVTGSGLVLIVIVYAVTVPIMVKMMNAVQEADIKASVVASDVFGSIRMISACGAHHKMAEKYKEWVIESRRRGLKMSPIVAIQQAPGQSTSCHDLTLQPLHVSN